MPALDVEEAYAAKLKSQRRNSSCIMTMLTESTVQTSKSITRKRMPAELCSTGEQKSLLISIILAQTKCQTLDKGFAPILLLTEVVAHLDDIKREALLTKIRDLKVQAWITSTDPSCFVRCPAKRNSGKLKTIPSARDNQERQALYFIFLHPPFRTAVLIFKSS
ncbi:MAG: hypothetical protein ACLSHR_11740 [Oscillospiraceae bacterium]